ncbi:prepilin-type N-terminal cleavage/methylation domain-containing protein [Patescibacteria group bacterium]|nr:prepilin-type N-terminal cleavage/methylation domain-containing protein [Patescibacteria group bacterium]
MKKNAFTLIEVLVVVSIMGVLAAFVMPSVGNFNESNIASQTIQNIASDIESTKFKAISGATYNSVLADWGIYVNCLGSNNQYSLNGYAIGTYTVHDGSSIVKTLPSGFTFNASTTTCNSTLKFNRISGISSQVFNIGISSASGIIKSITVNSNGSVLY